MPFGSYEASKEQAFSNAARVMKETGCGAIKLEGGARMAETIALPRRARRAGDGACRPDAAVDQYARLVPRAGARRGRLGGRSKQDARRSPRPAPSRWSSRRWPSRSARKITGDGRRIPTIGIGASRRPATGRSWCWRTCSACRRGCRNSSSAMAISGPASRRRWPITPPTCARARFRGPEHVYPMKGKKA